MYSIYVFYSNSMYVFKFYVFNIYIFTGVPMLSFVFNEVLFYKSKSAWAPLYHLHLLYLHDYPRIYSPAWAPSHHLHLCPLTFIGSITFNAWTRSVLCALAVIAESTILTGSSSAGSPNYNAMPGGQSILCVRMVNRHVTCPSLFLQSRPSNPMPGPSQLCAC